MQIPLSVKSENGHQYLWYHRNDDQEPFFPLNQRQSTMTATTRGEFMVKVFNTVCESFSPVITIKNDSVELTLNPIGRICTDAPEGLSLVATPAGGQWSGQGVTSGKLFTNLLANGTHTLTYKYTSSRQCQYQESIQYQLDRLVTPSVQRLSGNLCIDGAVSLGIRSSLEGDVTYSWLKKGNADTEFGAMDQTGQNISVNERGVYKVIASDGQCSAASNTITVDEASFPLEMQPGEQQVIACDQSPVQLSINPHSQNSYEWYYSEGETLPASRLMGQNGNALTVAETGYYYAVVTSGVCQQESQRKHVVFKEASEIFVPNIVTPNNDSRNDFFEIKTNMDVLDFTITNRYGSPIFTSGGDNKWTGEGNSSGVYYWLVRYRTCEGEVNALKGFLHLMR